MTREQAFKKASLRSAKSHDERFVVCEAGEFDTATEDDLHDFWLGAEVVACFIDGEFQE